MINGEEFVEKNEAETPDKPNAIAKRLSVKVRSLGNKKRFSNVPVSFWGKKDNKVKCGIFDHSDECDFNLQVSWFFLRDYIDNLCDLTLY